MRHQNHEQKEIADIIGDNENEGRPKADGALSFDFVLENET